MNSEKINKMVFKEIEKMLDNMQNKAILHETALGGLRIIRNRTRRGVDVSGAKFEPYSKAYKNYKANVLKIPASPVNLQANDIDGMLAKLDYELQSGQIHMFSRGRRKSGKKRIRNMDLLKWHTQDGVGKAGIVRNFWGFNEQTEVPKLLRIAKQDVMKFILKSV